MEFTFCWAAVFTAAPRLAKLLELASTSRMLHAGQMALAMSRSRAISRPQPTLGEGAVPAPLVMVLGVVLVSRVSTTWPAWFIFVMVGPIARPNCSLYFSRSCRAFGLS